MAPKVFLSYAHDSAEHKDLVLRFAAFLRGQGVEAVLDTWSSDARRDWYSWAVRQLTEADYVLVVASARFRLAGDGLAAADEHRGVQSEAAVMRELLCGDRARWLPKILPVVLPGHDIDEIPLFLQPHTASRYVVTDLTPQGADELLRVITGRPVHVAPPVRALPAAPAALDVSTDSAVTAPAATVPGLSGREAELSRFAALLDDALAGAGRSAESLAALERALAAPGIDPRHHARLLVLAARTHRNVGEVDAALAFARRALAEAELLDDRWAVAWALHVVITGSIMRGEVRAALPLFERALAVTEGDAALSDLRMLVHINHAVALGDLDRYESAIAAAGEVRGLAERMGSLVRLAQARSALAELLFDTGRWDEALAELETIDDHIEDPAVACCDHGVAAVIAFHRGDPETARRHLSRAAPVARLIGGRVVGALALARSLDRECDGELDEALAALTGCLLEQAEELEEMEDLFPDAVRLAVLVGDRRTAVELTRSAETLAERSPVPHRTAVALYCRGLLEDNPDGLLLAAKYFGDAGRPLPRAMAFEAAAVVLVADGAEDAAGSTVAAARDIYTSLRAARDTARLATMSLTRGERPLLGPAAAVAQTPYEFLRQQVHGPPS